MKTHKYVGLDVHSDTTMIAVAEGGRRGEVRLQGEVSSVKGELLLRVGRLLRSRRYDSRGCWL
jgi:hypothetical protein